MYRSKLQKPVYSGSSLDKLLWSCPSRPIKRLISRFGSSDLYKKYTSSQQPRLLLVNSLVLSLLYLEHRFIKHRQSVCLPGFNKISKLIIILGCAADAGVVPLPRGPQRAGRASPALPHGHCRPPLLKPAPHLQHTRPASLLLGAPVGPAP